MRKIETEKLPPKSLPMDTSSTRSITSSSFFEDTKSQSKKEIFADLGLIKPNNEVKNIYNLKKMSSMKRSLKLNFHEKKLRNIAYMFTHILFPVLFASCFIFILSLSQFYVRDYCFYKEICDCQSGVIKLYTFCKEIITCDLTNLQLFYYWFFFLQREISLSSKWKYFFIIFNVIVYLVLYSFYANFENDQKMENFRMIKSGSLGVSSFFFLLLNFCRYEFKKKSFLYDIMWYVFIALILAFHEFFFKLTLSFKWFFFLRNQFTVETARNVFKLSVFLYYKIYQALVKLFIFYYFKKNNDENFQNQNSILYYTKICMIELRSIEVFNAITIPFDNTLGIISLLCYIHTVVQNYSNLSLTKIIWRLLRLKKKVDPKAKSYSLLFNGCGLEINLVILIRIAGLKTFGRFFYFMRFTEIYSNCALENKDLGHLIMLNIIFVIGFHLFIFVILLFIMIKKKVDFFEIEVESHNFFFKILSLISCFVYVDAIIQVMIKITIYSEG